MSDATVVRPGSPRTVLLQCPRCSGPLSGVSIDRVFFCNACRIGVDFWEDPPGIQPVAYAAAPKTGDGHTIWLPVWHYRTDIQVRAQETDPDALEKAREAVPETVCIFGSVFQRINLFGDPNADYSSETAPIATGEGGGEIIGCQLRRRHADKLLLPVAASVIDRVQDITDLEIQVMIKERILIGVPFTIREKWVIDQRTGYRINRMAFLMEPFLPVG